MVQLGASSTVNATYKYPSEVLVCPSGTAEALATNTGHFKKTSYETVVKEVIALYDAEQTVPKQTAFAACLLRLAGHDLMDFRRATTKGGDSSGGSDGCVNFLDPDNAGLGPCLKKSGIQTVYGKHCGKVSLADFIVIAAEAVVARMATGYDAKDPFKAGTMAARFRDQLKVGRSTVKECPDNTGLMPNPEQGCNALKAVFLDHVYYERWNKRKSWQLTAAISGAHTIGHAKPANSGYDGHWSTVEDQGKFNNGYYKSMMGHGWGPERAVNGNTGKNQWERIDVQSCNNTHREMMLNSDLCLAYQYNTKHAQCMKDNKRSTRKCNKLQRKGVNNLDASKDSCCAWLSQGILLHRNIIPKDGTGSFCGIKGVKWGNFRGVCCRGERSDSIGDCDAFNWPKGPAFDYVLAFGKSEETFYATYLTAWKRATENGFPRPLEPM